MPERRVRLTILTVVVLAFALRAYRLDAQSLWYDEGLSVQLASLPPAETVSQSAATDHPPLHALLLNGWMRLAGASEYSVRFPSVFFGVLAVALTYALGSWAAGRRAGLAAAALLAIAPLGVWYGQEARGYSLLVALVLVAVLAFLRLESGDRRRRVWLAYVLSSAAALYAHYFAIFPLAALNLSFALRWLWRRASRRPSVPRPARWLLAQAAVAALFLPWLPNALAQASSNATYFPGRVTWDTVVSDSWRAFAAGDFAHLPQPNLPPPTGAMWLAVVLLGVASPLIGRLLPSLSRGATDFRRRGVLPLVALVVVPLVLMSALAWIKPKFAPRYLLPSLPAFVALAALGLDALLRFRTRWLVAAAILPLALIPAVDGLVVSQIYFDPPLARPDVRAVAAYITANQEPGDAILLVGGHQLPVFTYYYRGANRVVALPPGLLPPARSPLDARALPQLAGIAAEAPRAWLVLWQQDLADPTGIVLGTLRDHAKRLQVGQNFHDMSLLLFDLRDAVIPTGPQHPVDRDFDDAIRLTGYDLNSNRFLSGQDLNFALYFQSSGPLARDYRAFTHLLGPDGAMVAQDDRIAGADSYPTSLWATGALLRNAFSMRLPGDLPPGAYRLVVGLYDDSGRLPVASGGDAIDLTDIVVSK